MFLFQFQTKQNAGADYGALISKAAKGDLSEITAENAISVFTVAAQFKHVDAAAQIANKHWGLFLSAYKTNTDFKNAWNELCISDDTKDIETSFKWKIYSLRTNWMLLKILPTLGEATYDGLGQYGADAHNRAQKGNYRLYGGEWNIFNLGRYLDVAAFPFYNIGYNIDQAFREKPEFGVVIPPYGIMYEHAVIKLFMKENTAGGYDVKGPFELSGGALAFLGEMLWQTTSIPSWKEYRKAREEALRSGDMEKIEMASLKYGIAQLDSVLLLALGGGTAMKVASRMGKSAVIKRAELQIAKDAMEKGMEKSAAEKLAQESMTGLKEELKAMGKNAPKNAQETGEFIAKKMGIVVEIPTIPHSIWYGIKQSWLAVKPLARHLAESLCKPTARFLERNIVMPLLSTYYVAKGPYRELITEFKETAITALKAVKNNGQLLTEKEASQIVESLLKENSGGFSKKVAGAFNAAYGDAGLSVRADALKGGSRELIPYAFAPNRGLVEDMAAQLRRYYEQNPDKLISGLSAANQAEVDVVMLLENTLRTELKGIGMAISEKTGASVPSLLPSWLRYEASHTGRKLIGASVYPEGYFPSALGEITELAAGGALTKKGAYTLTELAQAFKSAMKESFIDPLKGGTGKKLAKKIEDGLEFFRAEKAKVEQEMEKEMARLLKETPEGKKIMEMQRERTEMLKKGASTESEYSKLRVLDDNINTSYATLRNSREGATYKSLYKKNARLDKAINAIEELGDKTSARHIAAFHAYVDMTYTSFIKRGAVSPDAPEWLLSTDRFLSKANLKKRYTQLSDKIDNLNGKLRPLDNEIDAAYRKYCQENGRVFKSLSGEENGKGMEEYAEYLAKNAGEGDEQAAQVLEKITERSAENETKKGYVLEKFAILGEGLAGAGAIGGATYFYGLANVVSTALSVPIIAIDYYAFMKMSKLAAANAALKFVPLAYLTGESASIAAGFRDEQSSSFFSPVSTKIDALDNVVPKLLKKEKLENTKLEVIFYATEGRKGVSKGEFAEGEPVRAKIGEWKLNEKTKKWGVTSTLPGPAEGRNGEVALTNKDKNNSIANDANGNPLIRQIGADGAVDFGAVPAGEYNLSMVKRDKDGNASAESSLTMGEKSYVLQGKEGEENFGGTLEITVKKQEGAAQGGSSQQDSTKLKPAPGDSTKANQDSTAHQQSQAEKTKELVALEVVTKQPRVGDEVIVKVYRTDVGSPNFIKGAMVKALPQGSTDKNAIAAHCTISKEEGNPLLWQGKNSRSRAKEAGTFDLYWQNEEGTVIISGAKYKKMGTLTVLPKEEKREAEAPTSELLSLKKGTVAHITYGQTLDGNIIALYPKGQKKEKPAGTYKITGGEIAIRVNDLNIGEYDAYIYPENSPLKAVSTKGFNVIEQID